MASAECVLGAFGQMLELALEAVSAWLGVQGSRVVTCAGGMMLGDMGRVLVWQERQQAVGDALNTAMVPGAEQLIPTDLGRGF